MSFTVINEGFNCINCGKSVAPSKSTCRDHCPFCLHSIHVDIDPGDRLSTCKGLLVPVDYFQNNKKGIVIVYKCNKCGMEKNNKAIIDHDPQPDDYDSILRIKKNH